MSEGTQRRLAAIVSADVVGYSRLMGVDEAGTHARLKARYGELVAPGIAAHGGRVVKLMGDGLLAEFASAVDAVAWALQTQAEAAGLDGELPEEQRIRYRIGVNLGDIIVDGDDIFGDGVNVAARLQEIAEPGGVCISDIVQGQVRGKLDGEFADGGAVELKNIAQPVRVWRWSPGQAAAQTAPAAGTDAADAAADAPPPLPDKPSIAVLPFENMSGDPEQDYFVDGMVEDILTTLSKIPALFVIARNSSFKYKGKNPDVRDVGRELGVKYVVEGSVRKAGNRVRVTAQLVECADGRHLWAEHYDGDLDDVFELQDRITQQIVTELDIHLVEGEIARVWRERSGSPLVYEKFIKGQDLYMNFARQTHNQARRELEELLESDPEYLPALALLGLTLVDQARFGWAPDADAAYDAALAVAERALAIDPGDGSIYSIISYARSFQRRHDEAVEAAERAVALSPNHASTFHMSAMSHIYAGNFQTGRDYELQCARLSPLDREIWLVDLGRAQYHLGEFEEARRLCAWVLQTQPRWLTAQTIALAALWRLGREDEARGATADIETNHPKFSVRRWARGWPYRRAADLAALMDPLRAAGLPE